MKQGFPPVIPSEPRILVLGSLPGDMSITKGEYYGHPRNRFWTVMASVLGLPLPDDYPARLRMISGGGIMLWDVYASAEREGSLDTGIRRPVFNGIASLLESHPVRLIVTNGAAAAKALRSCPGIPAGIPVVNLPSTSPANASWRTPDLVSAWKSALGPFL